MVRIREKFKLWKLESRGASFVLISPEILTVPENSFE